PPGRARSIKNSHPRLVTPMRIAGAAGAHRWDREAVKARIPQALETDVVAILAMHPGDAVILVEPRAVGGGKLRRQRLGLARPGDDPAGVVALEVGLVSSG